LKEAFSIGTGNAVTSDLEDQRLLRNQAIKILMPEKIRKVADALGRWDIKKDVTSSCSA